MQENGPKYAKNEDNTEFDITVTMPDGSSPPIEHILVYVAKVTLGVPICPYGTASAHLKVVQDKMQA